MRGAAVQSLVRELDPTCHEEEFTCPESPRAETEKKKKKKEISWVPQLRPDPAKEINKINFFYKVLLIFINKSGHRKF